MDAPQQKPRPVGPQKVIRTFAGDLAAFQEGRLTTAPPPPPAPVQESASPPPAPPIVTSAPPPSPPKPAPATFSGESPIHTYSSDFTDRVKKTDASPMTVLAAEEDAGPAPTASVSAPKSSPRGWVYVLAGIFLLGVGIGSAYLAYGRYLKNTTPVPAPTSAVAAPIFTDESEQLSGAGAALMAAVQQSVARPLQANGVRLLYENATTTVFEALQLGAPGQLLRNLVPEGSMAGVINDGAQSPFFILSVASYPDTFAGMLAWEPTLPDTLSKLFPALSVPTTIATTTVKTATTTPKTKKKIIVTTVATTTVPQAPTATPQFKDEVVSNHDTRAYTDAYGRTQVIYGYFDERTLIIARDEAAFKALMDRLTTSRSQ